MFDISLVIPTYGRYSEVEVLLQTIAVQTYPLHKIEVIIVDQNDKIDLHPVIEKFVPVLNIIHKKTEEKGIANAKNLGIKLSSAPVITFPDDDCTYYEDTVTAALNFFDKNPMAEVVYGRLYNRENKLNIMRNWAEKEIALNIYNFHLNYSAITCFTKLKDFFFDSRLGTGTSFHSGEELDYVIRAIKEKYNVVYTNAIDVYHPPLNLSVMPVKKIYNYATGYGAVCKKQLSFPIFYLFAKSCINQLRLIAANVLLFNKEKTVKHYNALNGRIHGFVKFKDQ